MNSLQPVQYIERLNTTSEIVQLNEMSLIVLRLFDKEPLNYQFVEKFLRIKEFNFVECILLVVFNFVETLQLNLNYKVQLFIFNRSIVFFSTELN